EWRAQVVGDAGQELVLLAFEVALGGDVMQGQDGAQALTVLGDHRRGADLDGDLVPVRPDDAELDVEDRLAGCQCPQERPHAWRRAVMSRITLITSSPPADGTGLRLISTGKTWPSLRRARRSRPLPIGRVRGRVR